MQWLRGHGCARGFCFSGMKTITRQTRPCWNEPDGIQRAKGRVWVALYPELCSGDSETTAAELLCGSSAVQTEAGPAAQDQRVTDVRGQDRGRSRSCWHPAVPPQPALDPCQMVHETGNAKHPRLQLPEQGKLLLCNKPELLLLFLRQKFLLKPA